jgi:hypothetical protein
MVADCSWHRESRKGRRATRRCEQLFNFFDRRIGRKVWIAPGPSFITSRWSSRCPDLRRILSGICKGFHANEAMVAIARSMFRSFVTIPIDARTAPTSWSRSSSFQIEWASSMIAIAKKTGGLAVEVRKMLHASVRRLDANQLARARGCSSHGLNLPAEVASRALAHFSPCMATMTDDKTRK